MEEIYSRRRYVGEVRELRKYNRLSVMNLILRVGLRGNLVLGNTRELDRELFYKIVYLIYFYSWSVLGTVHPTLNDHVLSMRPTCGVHIV